MISVYILFGCIFPPNTYLLFSTQILLHQFKCLCIHVTWLILLLPIIRYLSYIQFFTLINSAAKNVFVKNSPSFGFFPWEYLQRGITRSKSMKYFIALALYCQIAF